jgi:hypothetical protein
VLLLTHVSAAPSLTLRHNANHGMHIHILKPRREAVKLDASENFVQISESKSTKTYFSQVMWLTVMTMKLELTWLCVGMASFRERNFTNNLKHH